MTRVLVFCAALMLATCAAESAQRPLTLGVDGTRFTLNGRGTFLLGISYYAGIGASHEVLVEDLDRIKGAGFNWIRVWATWGGFGNDVSAVDADGNPRLQQLQGLRRIVEECERRGIVVDVTLSRGNGVSGSPKLQGLIPHRNAVESIARELRGFRNWYLDLSNERNIQDARHTSFDDLRALRAAAKALAPSLLITASQGADIGRDELKRYIDDVQVDFITPHRPRHKGSAAETESMTKQYLQWMRELKRTVPVHYQEPFRRGYADYNPPAADFLTDLHGAIKGGAAGWCFHNGSERGKEDGRPRRSFDLREGALFKQLDSEELAVAAGAQRILKENP